MNNLTYFILKQTVYILNFLISLQIKLTKLSIIFGQSSVVCKINHPIKIESILIKNVINWIIYSLNDHFQRLIIWGTQVIRIYQNHKVNPWFTIILMTSTSTREGIITLVRAHAQPEDGAKYDWVSQVPKRLHLWFDLSPPTAPNIQL